MLTYVSPSVYAPEIRCIATRIRSGESLVWPPAVGIAVEMALGRRKARGEEKEEVEEQGRGYYARNIYMTSPAVRAGGTIDLRFDA